MPSNYEIARLIAKYSLDATDYVRGARLIEDHTKLLNGGMQLSSQRLNMLGVGIRGYGAEAVSAMVPLLGLGAAVRSAMGGLQMSAQFEKMEKSFEVMLKGAEKGNALSEMIRNMAAETPLLTRDLEQAGKMLLTIGRVGGSEVIPYLKMLGDLSMGDAAHFQHMSYAFAEMLSIGKVYQYHMRMFATAGFNPLEEISRMTGQSMVALRQREQEGTIAIDEIIKAMEHATGATGDFNDAMKKIGTQTLYGVWSTFADNIQIAKTAIGDAVAATFKLKEILVVLSKAVQDVTNWFRNLSPEIQKLAVLTAAFASATLTLAVIWPFVGDKIIGILKIIEVLVLGILNPIKWITTAFSLLGLAIGAIGSLFTPIGLIVAGLIALVALFIGQAGGIEEAFKQAKEGLQQFWEWTKPIRQAIVQLFETIKVVAQQGWERFKEISKQAMAWIKQNIGIDFNEIRNTIVTAIIFVEYSILNTEQVWNAAWKGMKYVAVAAANFIMNNLFLIMFSPLLAGLIDLGVNWNALWQGIKEGARNAFEWIGKNWQMLIIGIIPAIISGAKIDWSKIWSDMGKVTFDWKGIKIQGMDDLETRLKKEWDEAAGKLGADFEAFKQMRLKQFAELDKEQKKGAVDLGKGDPRIQGLVNDMHKLQSVAIGSAEALGRINDYRERMNKFFEQKPKEVDKRERDKYLNMIDNFINPKDKTKGQGKGFDFGGFEISPAGPVNVIPPQNLGALEGKTINVKLDKESLALLAQIAGKPMVALDGMDL